MPRKTKSTRRKRTNRKPRNRRTRRTSLKASLSQTKPTRLVHQIYGIFDDGIPLKDIPIFYENVKKTKAFCKKQGYKHKMWDLKKCVELVKKDFPQYLALWKAFTLPIQRADFIRYLILYKHGGIYVDCDIHPLKSLEDLFKKDYFFVTWHDDKQKLPYNAVMGSKKGEKLFLEIAEESKRSFYEKVKDPIYKKWKGRFVFQTTGHRMLERVLKNNNAKDHVLDVLRVKTKDNRIVEGNNPYFEDDNASVWFKNQ
jgi:mannosyltransferase OCH1-like enzyme